MCRRHKGGAIRIFISGAGILEAKKVGQGNEIFPSASLEAQGQCGHACLNNLLVIAQFLYLLVLRFVYLAAKDP